MAHEPALTVLIPLYNEADSLPHLKRELDAALEETELDAEILFVDDGSRDNSWEIITGFAHEDPRVQVVRLRRNQGKSAALDAGFKRARGGYVVTMDADLQDDPHEIPNLIERLEEGYDMVSGWKKKRHDPLSKTVPSKVFNGVARLTSGLRLHDFNCGLKIYRGEVVRELDIYGEQHRFIPILAHSRGWRVGELIVKHHPRRWGKTKFGASRFLKGFLDLLTVLFLTQFAARPMHLFGSLGLLSLLAGFVILVYMAVGWFMGHYIGTRPLFFLGILMMIVGVQFFSIGLLGEQVTNLRASMQRRSPPTLDDPDQLS